MPKSATMEFVSLPNGETIAYQDVGRQNKEILVLIHGNMTSSQRLGFSYRTIAESISYLCD